MIFTASDTSHCPFVGDEPLHQSRFVLLPVCLMKGTKPFFVALVPLSLRSKLNLSVFVWHRKSPLLWPWPKLLAITPSALPLQPGYHVAFVTRHTNTWSTCRESNPVIPDTSRTHRRQCFWCKLEQGDGLEPSSVAYHASALPVELTLRYAFATTSIVEVQIPLPHLVRGSLGPHNAASGEK